MLLAADRSGTQLLSALRDRRAAASRSRVVPACSRRTGPRPSASSSGSANRDRAPCLERVRTSPNSSLLGAKRDRSEEDRGQRGGDQKEGEGGHDHSQRLGGRDSPHLVHLLPCVPAVLVSF